MQKVVMENKNRAELVELGLSPTEAQVYLALLQKTVPPPPAFPELLSIKSSAP